MSLLPNEWQETAQVFVDSIEHVLGAAQHMSEDTRNKLNTFLWTLVQVEKPYMLAAPKGMPHAIELVFGDEIIRDFVLTLGFTFYARWGASRERYGSLVESLAFAVSGDPDTANPSPRESDASMVATPQEIRDLLPEPDVVVKLLEQNKWLVTLLMIPLFVVLEVPKPKPASRHTASRLDAGQ